MMDWISIDPSERASGIARWRGDQLVSVTTLRPAKGAKEKKAGAVWVGAVLAYPTLFDAWRSVLGGQAAVFVEESKGKSPRTVALLGEVRGYIRAVCELLSTPYKAVDTSEWRRVVGEVHGFTFPTNREDAKARAVELVSEVYGLSMTDDEAEAVCVGLWALRTRAVRS